jgi:hypothetical protein
MEGVADEARMYVFLLFIAVFMRLGFIQRRKRFQERLRCSQFEAGSGGMRRTEPFQSPRKIHDVADEKLRGYWKAIKGHNSGSSISHTWESIVQRRNASVKGMTHFACRFFASKLDEAPK